MKNRRTSLISAALFSSALVFAAAAHADPPAYTPVDKLGRGVAGMVGGALELPGQMVDESEKHGPAGLPLGFAKGLGMVVARELTGVYEFVTAPLPVPRGYRPVLEPEYPWDHFQNL
ncbi:MAG TPA: exosortase system-associated protein, TIGR04073 family [Candidatus Eisenbacteria bacterium]|nr:exosortase system-associated protein, TIGR04073 family [Candidatus Eisenbacteria bacterium]